MANVTDPLARPIHGTNPQNLIEYITRQRIYDSQYWKEHLFGCTAADVAEKAALHLQAIGGSFGGNAKPTRFLCLVLKMLQIQPEDDIVDELINNENFKYVRALGAFYLRLTGRPADIYEKLEPLLNDFRKLKYRNPMDWKLFYIDEFIDQLLTDNRVCGIALPRLPNRDVLVESGYLDGPRRSAVATLLDLPQQETNDNEKFENCVKSADQIKGLLKRMAQDGNAAARDALIERGHEFQSSADGEESIGIKESSIELHRDNEKVENIIDVNEGELKEENHIVNDKKKRKFLNAKKKTKSKKKFGKLFKSSATATTDDSAVSSCDKTRIEEDGGKKIENEAVEQSDEYWNEQRAKLGLKPLQK